VYHKAVMNATYNKLVVETKVTLGDGKLASRVKRLKYQVQDHQTLVTRECVPASYTSANTNTNTNGDLVIHNTSQAGKSIVNLNGKVYLSNSGGSSVIVRNGEANINGVKVGNLKAGVNGDTGDKEHEEEEAVPPYYDYTFHELKGVKFTNIKVRGRGQLSIVDTDNLSDDLVMKLNDKASVKFLHSLHIPELWIESYNDSIIEGDYSTADILLIDSHNKSQVGKFIVNNKAALTAVDDSWISVRKASEAVKVSTKGSGHPVHVYQA